MNPKRILFSNDEKIVIEDTRVSVTRPSNGDWNLQIAHARYNDSGEYLCQINTSPVKIKRVFLYVQGTYLIYLFIYFEAYKTKSTESDMWKCRHANTQISLGVRPVWLKSLLYS